MTTIRLLVVDENDHFLLPLTHFAHTLPALELTGVLTNIDELTDFDGESPDIVLMASALLKQDGVEILRSLKARWPSTRCYRLTVFDESQYDENAGLRGLDGSMPRSEIERHLKAIVSQLQSGSSKTTQPDDTDEKGDALTDQDIGDHERKGDDQ
ncbi:MAG: hypothetical protein AAF465_07330 [Pseudomonadota bacterium]